MEDAAYYATFSHTDSVDLDVARKVVESAGFTYKGLEVIVAGRILPHPNDSTRLVITDERDSIRYSVVGTKTPLAASAETVLIRGDLISLPKVDEVTPGLATIRIQRVGPRDLVTMSHLLGDSPIRPEP